MQVKCLWWCLVSLLYFPPSTKRLFNYLNSYSTRQWNLIFILCCVILCCDVLLTFWDFWNRMYYVIMRIFNIYTIIYNLHCFHKTTIKDECYRNLVWCMLGSITNHLSYHNQIYLVYVLVNMAPDMLMVPILLFHCR